MGRSKYHKRQKRDKVRLDVRVSYETMALVEQVEERYSRVRSTSNMVDAALLMWAQAALTYGLDGDWQPLVYPPGEIPVGSATPPGSAYGAATG